MTVIETKLVTGSGRYACPECGHQLQLDNTIGDGVLYCLWALCPMIHVRYELPRVVVNLVPVEARPAPPTCGGCDWWPGPGEWVSRIGVEFHNCRAPLSGQALVSVDRPACQHYKAKGEKVEAPSLCASCTIQFCLRRGDAVDVDAKPKDPGETCLGYISPDGPHSVCLSCGEWKSWDGWDASHRYCHPMDRKVPLRVGWECHLHPEAEGEKPEPILCMRCQVWRDGPHSPYCRWEARTSRMGTRIILECLHFQEMIKP